MFCIKTLFIFTTISVLVQSKSSLAQQAQQQPQQQDEEPDKLKVLVLYESLCPDSVRFMERQLKPSYDLIKNYIDITLVPFGKSISQDGGSKFYCQHGPEECIGNRQHSCVIKQTFDQAAQVKFATCQMASRKKDDITHCAEEAGLPSNIEQCMNTELGTFFQLADESITAKYTPSFVPTVVYDEVFNQKLQDNSLRNFRGTVCSLLQKRGLVSFNSPACQ